MFFSDDMKELIKLFKKHHVEFAVCGGFAVAHYGFIRATMDFDLLILPNNENAKSIIKALDEFGFGDSGITEDSFLNPGTAITLGAQPNQIDLLTSMSSQPSHKIIESAENTEIQGLSMKVVSYESLLFAKKESTRLKDKLDAEELEKLH